ncbi:MAG: potassium/proton antiporter, partial [Candidatus Ratteibacteria bacterium]|nr:potassium/proton antiporter [Candidatus Ratteibacteria bacterium]
GMLAGTEGLGGIYFANPWFAKSIGIIALIFIIFYGGLDTEWGKIRPVMPEGIVLATFGVLLTAAIVGYFSMLVFKFSLLEGMLLGSIISSTDAAAVFSILRSKRVSLKGSLRPLLEFESGSNDPMAVFLTISFISFLMNKDIKPLGLIPMFVIDMGIGILMGIIMSKIILFILKRLKLDSIGLYPVLTISLVLLTYSLTVVLKGNGFMAVYIVGLLAGKHGFLYKNTVVKFHEGLAWLMQITMFLTLGLFVFPSQLKPIISIGILTAFALMFLARPISVFLCLAPFKINLREKLMVSWVGLRGAVPIILATFPLLANVPQATMIFNIIFFVVLASVIIQGTSIPFVSKILKVNTPLTEKRRYPLEFEKTEGIDANLMDLIVPYNSIAEGKTISELNISRKSLIVLIARGEEFIVPNGSTMIESGDVLLVLAKEEELEKLQKTLATLKPK